MYDVVGWMLSLGGENETEQMRIHTVGSKGITAQTNKMKKSIVSLLLTCCPNSQIFRLE